MGPRAKPLADGPVALAKSPSDAALSYGSLKTGLMAAALEYALVYAQQHIELREATASRSSDRLGQIRGLIDATLAAAARLELEALRFAAAVASFDAPAPRRKARR